MIALKQFLCYLTDLAYADGDFRPTAVGGTHLGSGCSRCVYAIEFQGTKIAIKFEYGNPKARRHNLREWINYRTMPAAITSKMAIPLAISTCGRAIAFEYVPHTLSEIINSGNLEHDDGRGWRQDLIGALRDSGFSEQEIGSLTYDNHNANIGVRDDGQLVWIDYATHTVS